jgi:hypothetical protein
MKVKVKIDFKNHNLREVFPLGYEFELEKVLTEKDELIPAKYVNFKNEKGFIEQRMISEEFIVPAGSFIKTRFKGANGEYYDDDTMRNAIGYKPFEFWLEKV